MEEENQKQKEIFEETVPIREKTENENNQVENVAKCLESNKVVLVSLYEDILKKAKEIAIALKNFCKKTYEFLFEKLYTQEESIEV